MSEVDPALIASLRSRYDHCFACGLGNPEGMHIDGFELGDDGSVRARYVPRPEHRGFSGQLHGGIVAAALDEIMAWTAILAEGTMAVTAKLEIGYRKPAPPDGELTLVGTLDERTGSRMRLRGEVRHGDTLVANGTGLFVATEPVGDLAR